VNPAPDRLPLKGALRGESRAFSEGRGRRFINEGLADGSLKPNIARTFPLEQIVEAHWYMESNQQFGKIVVTDE
jgi:NADPH:quinone reductase-like Zn-dependent oxidoreductase